MTDRIVYQNSELYYYREGRGNQPILLFHGFGQDHQAFETWNEGLQNAYTVYTFDLFFHGKSQWANPQALTKENWKEILQLFFEQEKVENFEVAGFSIGAKFALAAFELFPDKVKKIVLMAPDGIKNNFWYSLATSTPVMRSLFRSTILKPHRLVRLIKLLQFLRLEDKSLLRFVALQLNTEQKRQRVYHSWIYFRHLHFNLKNISGLLNSRNIPVIFILGAWDKVIPAEKVESFANTLNNHQFQIISAGHPDLIPKGLFLLTK